MDLQLAARVHGSEIGDAVGCSLEHCPCDVHGAIDPDVSSADARMKIFQRDFGPGCDRCSRVSAQNSVRLSIQIGTQIGIGEIVFSPVDLLAPLNAVAFRPARHFAVCRQPQIFFSLRASTSGTVPKIRNSNCGQRHVPPERSKGHGHRIPHPECSSHSHHRPVRHTPDTETHLSHCKLLRSSSCPPGQRGREVQREGLRSTPARNFFHLRFIAKASFFHPILLQEKSSTVHFLGYRGALVFAINPGLVFG